MMNVEELAQEFGCELSVLVFLLESFLGNSF